MNTKNKDLAINGGKPVRIERIPIHKPTIEADDVAVIQEAIKSTFVSGDGPLCREFEKELASYLGMKHVFFLTSCTAALDLAFMVKDLKKGGEVLVPNFTYTSTALGPLLNGYKVVLVDVYDYNGNIDISKIEAKINENTVAIAPVDYAGNPVEMDELMQIARKYNLYVVHDTAQSIGSKYKGLCTGVKADVCTFSFHGTKNMTTGEGGALVTNDDEIADRVRIAREKGTDKHTFITDPNKRGFYEYMSLGNSYVQSNILGGLGTTQIKKLDRLNNRRKEIAKYYLESFKDIEGVKLPTLTNGTDHNWHLFYMLIPPEHKSWAIEALIAEGVSANVHYNPLHMNSYYKDLGTDAELPNSIKFFNSYIRIPIYYLLQDAEVEDIVKAVRKVFNT